MSSSQENTSAGAAEYLERSAIEAQRKFLYFMVGLAFGILGLSIQASTEPTWLTKISWLALLLSSLSGIFRLQWEPNILQINKATLSAEEFKGKLETIRLQGGQLMSKPTGSPLNAGVLIKSQEEYIMAGKGEFSRLARKQERRYSIQMWAFVVGLLGLAADRIVLLGG